MIEIYTDGSCYPNDGTGNGGYSFVVVEDNALIHEYCRKESPTTSNRMEIQAIIDAIYFIQEELQGEDVVIYSDSKYCVRGYNDWIYKWNSRSWKTSMGGNVQNQDLWKELYELKGYTLKWVKGHAENQWNNLADELASYKNYDNI